MKATQENDREALNAVFQGRSYLSGFGELAPDAWENLQRQARRTLEPQIAEHLDILSKLSRRLEVARSAVERL